MVIHGIAFLVRAGLPVKVLSFCCLTESSDWQGR